LFGKEFGTRELEFENCFILEILRVIKFNETKVD